ncbi:hypothetical protein GCM10009678_43950 [Actinomadura kijaniata]
MWSTFVVGASHARMNRLHVGKLHTFALLELLPRYARGGNGSIAAMQEHSSKGINVQNGTGGRQRELRRATERPRDITGTPPGGGRGWAVDGPCGGGRLSPRGRSPRG